MTRPVRLLAVLALAGVCTSPLSGQSGSMPATSTGDWTRYTADAPRIDVFAAQERSVWDGVYTEAQSKRGEGVYMEICANCHGAALEGMDMSPPLAGATFGANWNELTMGDLAERLRISMPADRPGTMTRTQIADVMAYMLKANRYPAGASELPDAVPTLKMIRILNQKPE